VNFGSTSRRSRLDPLFSPLIDCSIIGMMRAAE